MQVNKIQLAYILLNASQYLYRSFATISAKSGKNILSEEKILNK